MHRTASNLAEAQQGRLRRFGATQCVDVHCHCLPGLDDGPATVDEAIALCRALVDDGITTVIATPHQLGRYDGQNEPAAVRRAVETLSAALAAEGVPLTVLPGADVRLDERIPKLLEADRVLTLADGGSYLLVELPQEAFIDLRPLVVKLAPRGVRLIVSHPERHETLIRHLFTVVPWLEAGAVLQITAASLLGEFGSVAGKAAWYWLRSHPAVLVGTDAHDTDGRQPVMSEAIDLVSKQLGHAVARRAFIENPLCVVEGQDMSARMARASAGGWA